MKPKFRGVYGVIHGSHRGELFAYIREDREKEAYEFLSMPKMVTKVVPIKSFEFGMENNIIEFIEVLPVDVHDVILAQYNNSLI